MPVRYMKTLDARTEYQLSRGRLKETSPLSPMFEKTALETYRLTVFLANDFDTIRERAMAELAKLGVTTLDDWVIELGSRMAVLVEEEDEEDRGYATGVEGVEGIEVSDGS